MRHPPWEEDGFAWWAEAFERDHGRPPTVEDYEEFRLAWYLSGEGAVEWTDDDWEAFYYARLAGLEAWLERGVVFTGAWTGAQILAQVQALNAIEATWGGQTERVLGLKDGLEIAPPPANPDFSGVAPAGTAYGTVNGRPFIVGAGEGSSIHPSDITQGYHLGDCYFLSALAALANTESGRDLIANNIRRNPDNLTYTVYLYERDDAGNFVEAPVIVSPDFPLDASGNPVFAQAGDADPATGEQELWVMLYEKAYAQHMGGYGVTQAGWGAAALELLTGVPSEGFVNPINFPELQPGEGIRPYPNKWIPESIQGGGMTVDELADRFDAGDAITVQTWPLLNKVDLPTIDVFGHPIDLSFNPAGLIHPLYRSNDLLGLHEYYVVGVDRNANEVTIRNPHGWHKAPIVVPYADFQKVFPLISVNPISLSPPSQPSVDRDFIPIV